MLAFELAGAAQNGALDILIGHIFVFSGEDGGAEAGIGVGVAAADAGGDGDFANDASEDAAALGVSSRLFVLDGGPF